MRAMNIGSRRDSGEYVGLSVVSGKPGSWGPYDSSNVSFLFPVALCYCLLHENTGLFRDKSKRPSHLFTIL